MQLDIETINLILMKLFIRYKQFVTPSEYNPLAFNPIIFNFPLPDLCTQLNIVPDKYFSYYLFNEN